MLLKNRLTQSRKNSYVQYLDIFTVNLRTIGSVGKCMRYDLISVYFGGVGFLRGFEVSNQHKACIAGCPRATI